MALCPHATLQPPNRYFFVSGGRNNFVLEDLAVLDLITKSWLEVQEGGMRWGTVHCLDAAAAASR
jgi:hypothetical protein